MYIQFILSGERQQEVFLSKVTGYKTDTVLVFHEWKSFDFTTEYAFCIISYAVSITNLHL